MIFPKIKINEKIFNFYEQSTNGGFSKNEFFNSKNNSQMSREEAFEIMGLRGTESKQEIKIAYYNLAKKVHPDHGGSAYLMNKLHQAKQMLLD